MLKMITRIIIINLLFILTLNQTFATTTKANFISLLLPEVNAINDEIKQQREKLLSLEKKHKGNQLTDEDKRWLKNLAENYHIKDKNTSHSSTWNTLKSRVDIIPPSLAIAQAATESGWGKSRFAKIGNSYFGQSCFRKGCGIKPNVAFKYGYYEVQTFNSINESVRSYMNNLNTHKAYQPLRNIRQQARQQDKLPTSLKMAQGLTRYSERGKSYVNYIASMIKSLKSHNLDQAI